MTIETKKLVISEELKRKVEMICKFAYVEYSFTNGYIINLKNTNIAYVKPHILKVKGNDYLIFIYKIILFIKSKKDHLLKVISTINCNFLILYMIIFLL